MKGLLLSLTLIATLNSFAQNCVQIDQAFINNTGANMYRLTVNYTGNGTKHMKISFYSGSISEATLISSTCISTHGSGTENVDFTSPLSPLAVITPGTGNCGGATCASQTVSFAGGPLPVKLSSFFASRSGYGVQINWNTSTEVNAHSFTIQKNKGAGYIDVTTVPASNRINGSSYSYTDNETSRETVYYRLVMKDMDGSVAYSETRMIRGGTETTFSVYPNPSTGNSSISLSDMSGPVRIDIMDKAGRLVRSQNLSNTNIFKIESLPKGTYMIRVTNQKGEVSTKMLSVI